MDGDKKCAARNPNGRYDAGAHPKERGDPEVPCGTCRCFEQSPGVGGPSRRNRQQGAPLRPIDGVRGSGLRPADTPNSDIPAR